MSEFWTDSSGTFHEVYTALAVVDNDLLGTFSYDSGRADLLYYRESFAFFCPHCGDIWGRIIATNSRGQQLSFRCLTVSCAKHHDWWNVPGSLLWGPLDALLPELPAEFIRREFLVHLNHVAKELV